MGVKHNKTLLPVRGEGLGSSTEVVFESRKRPQIVSEEDVTQSQCSECRIILQILPEFVSNLNRRLCVGGVAFSEDSV